MRIQPIEALSSEAQILGSVDGKHIPPISEDQDVKYGPLDDIKHSIDCLFGLTIIMRSLDSHSQSLSKHERISGDSEAVDLALVQETFPGIGDVLKERFQKSLLRRMEHLRGRREYSSQSTKALHASVGITQSKVPRKALTDDTLVASSSSRADSDTLRMSDLPEAFVTSPYQCHLCFSVIPKGQEWR